MLIISLNAFTQISTNETPFSFKEKLEKDDIPIITMPALNYEIVEAEDSIDNLNGLPPRFGFDFDVDINMENSGLWTDLPNKKGQLWQLEIYCPGALSINLLYDKFYIPEGGKFFIYSPDKNKKLGAFTHRNNKGDKMHPGAFATSLILNDRIILEYYASVNSNDIPVISIAKVVHGYKYIKGAKLFGDSGNCNVNINCNEGENWQDEKTSVALIVVGGTRWCTGSLINNTRGDGAPFLLTANHCLSGLDAISNPNASTWTFLWNYESPTCANGTDFTPPSTSGATVRANNSASDFALLELDETPFDLTPSLCLYYNGWDKSGSTSSNTTCIHHPSGDLKKISIDNDSPSSNGNYWRVNDWDTGTTEGGSSGSPLFNSNQRVIGQLYGGDAACGNDLYDDFGKLSVSWNNSTDLRRRLKDWLDPLGTNPTTLDGAYLFPTNNTNISGPSLVCYSGNSTFSLTGPTAGFTIDWDCNTSVLTQIGGDNGSSYVVRANSTSTAGQGWVRANIITDCGDTITKQVSVWAGKPDFYISGDTELSTFSAGAAVMNFGLPSNAQVQGVSIYEWDYTGPITKFIERDELVTYMTGAQTGLGNIYGTATNACGSTERYLGYRVTGGFLMTLTPNPSTSETTVSIESSSEEQSFDEVPEWDLEVYDQGQQLKARKMKIGGKHTTLNTSGWKEGVYIVRANYNGEVLTEKLVVKEQ